MISLRKFVGTKSFNTKQCPAGIYPTNIPPASPFLPILFSPQTFVAKPEYGGRIPLNNPKLTNLPHQKALLIKFKFSPIKSVISFTSNSNFHLITLYKFLHFYLYSLLLYHFFNFKRYLHICHPNFD